MSFSASVAELIDRSESQLVTRAAHWPRVPLGMLATILNGAPWKSEYFNDRFGEPLIRIRDVTTGRTDTYYSGPIDDAYWIEPGDLLVGMDGDFNVRVWSSDRGLLNQRVCKITPNELYLLKGYLAHILPGYLKLINDETHSVTVKHLSSRTIAEIPLPLPPLPEQRRIVTKLDRLRARSERARDELSHIPKLTERYKQAILSKAFSGELIGDTPASSQLPNDRCWDIPTSWKWVRFDQAAEIASNLVPTSEVQELPHIAPDNIRAGAGKLLPYRTVAEDDVKSAKHRFFPGQILYSKIRPYLRKAVLINFDGVCSADMYPINTRNAVVPQYLYYWMFSQQLADFVVAHEGRTVLPKVNQVGLNQTPFPLPPEEDQLAIAERLDGAFAWLDRIATEHARAEYLLPKLDQAILARAFRGELVPQDPNDEPASALLERIKAEREEPTKRRGRR